MSKVEAIEKEIQKLSPSEFRELSDWFIEHQSRIWDDQISTDADALRQMFAGAKQEHSAGKSQQL